MGGRSRTIGSTRTSWRWLTPRASKAQGSEYPCVVLPLLTQHYLMLQRNLLYTAVTRAKKLVVIVGSRKALAMAVKNNKVAKRYSALDVRLRA